MEELFKERGVLVSAVKNISKTKDEQEQNLANFLPSIIVFAKMNILPKWSY